MKDQMKRNDTIDILKGIFIIFVVITHFKWTDLERQMYLFPFWIQTAVPGFMFLSGYVYALAAERKGMKTLKEAYVPVDILKKLIRFTLPFVLILIIQLLLNKYCNGIPFSKSFISLLNGKHSPGSYYYPILIQFVFCCPLIYFCIKDNDKRGLFIIGVVNFAYEIFQIMFLKGAVYRLLLFRYLLIIAFGCYAGMGKKLNKRSEILLFIIGISYEIFVSYFGLPPITRRWRWTSMWAILFTVPVLNYLVKREMHCKPLSLIGRASYNIFLVQMVYYGFFYKPLLQCLGSRWLTLIIGVVGCVVVGILYYQVESPVTQRLIRRIKKTK